MGDGISEYQRAITSLFARTGTSAKLGLERTRALLEQLGDPHLRYPTFHVAGTNGKGSVVAMLDALLRSKGLRVGRYTSPHLIDFRERIVVNGVQISEQEVVEFLRRWEPEGERVGATFFELTTVMAFEHFAQEQVDVAVIETGMGGRLDATNVIQPAVAGITSVAMDHMEYLGDSIEAIAREKAGIIKSGIPTVVGDLPFEATREIERCAAAAGSSLWTTNTLFPIRSVSVGGEGTVVQFGDGFESPVRVGLVGEAQGRNAAVALAMLEVAGGRYSTSLDDARRVLPHVQVPGRFQRLGRFVVDVAHNVEGMRALRVTLGQIAPSRPIAAVVGILRDKQWLDMVLELASGVDRVVLTSPSTAPSDRQWDLTAVWHALSERIETLEVVTEFRVALDRAARVAATVVVCGSFYTAGEALAALGRAAEKE